MSFLRKLLGGGSEEEKPPNSGPSSPPPPPAAGSADAPPPAPKTPSLADSEPRQLHSYFEFVGGDSAKFYAVSLEEEDGGTWRVRYNFGRIGFPRAWDIRVEGASWARAAKTYMALVDERLGKGYEIQPWPATLKLPDGTTFDEEAAAADAARDEVLFRARKRGALPPPTGATVAGIALPEGILYAATPEGGSRGADPVIWVSAGPVANVGRSWSVLAAAFPQTGLWPLVIEADRGFDGFHGYLMDVPRGRHSEVVTILRRAWNGMFGDDDEFAAEARGPLGREFPGLADPTPGERTTSIDRIVASFSGHLGLVAVNRPADTLDAVGWTGAANYDGDPLDMSTVLRSWEFRFDAYLVGLGTDTVALAVGRPPPDIRSAIAIAAEHYAFCPDNVDQGPGSIGEYAPLLVNATRWDFWWD